MTSANTNHNMSNGLTVGLKTNHVSSHRFFFFFLVCFFYLCFLYYTTNYLQVLRVTKTNANANTSNGTMANGRA